ncbi:hypothetical protein BD626DRAFT_476499 [Schizophyllum amplum]|uniref:Uncharacterized protein n=1 Tax=Schizophyllum amplum TaxID=97359 RepID=A0A550CZG8_9AGAR|nr:hypothetical protein BD626DRAFT_476499 [Auriculariopsis ampla]
MMSSMSYQVWGSCSCGALESRDCGGRFFSRTPSCSSRVCTSTLPQEHQFGTGN